MFRRLWQNLKLEDNLSEVDGKIVMRKTTGNIKKKAGIERRKPGILRNRK